MADLSSILGSAGIGGQIGQAIVRLELDTAKYQAEMKAAQAQTTTGANSMSAGLAKFGGIAKAGLGLAAVGVVAFGAKAVSAASDLGEAINKSNVIFGNNAREIETWAEGGATAFGLSKAAALDAAGGFGAMLQTAGIATGASADMSKAIVQLAGDMASFNNIDPTEALDKLRSGLAGEAEPLRRFGVFLSEAAVQQEAYQSGLAKTGEALTEAQKVQARYNIIFAQTTKQQGDYARTSESLPNQLRTLTSQFTNLAASVGEVLLPAVTGAVEALNFLLVPVKELMDALKDIGTFTPSPEILEGAEGWLIAATELSEAWRGGRITNEEYQESLKRIAGQFEGDEPVIVRQVEHLIHLEQAFDETGKGADRFGKDLDEAGGKMRRFAGMTGEEFDDWSEKIKESIRSSIFVLEDLTSESDVTARDLERSFNHMVQESRQFARAMEDLPRGKWVNDEFLQFISEQGPEFLIGFASVNKQKQKEMQEQWEESGRVYDRAIRQSFFNLDQALDDLDNKETKHTVRVKYIYEGFDPSKPGMGGRT